MATTKAAKQSATWKGALVVGLVSVPVKLYSTADSSPVIRFHQYHSCKGKPLEHGVRIRQKQWCPSCNVEADSSEIHRGFEYAKGQHVVVSNADLDSVKSAAGDRMVVDVVTSDAIDPVYVEQTYFLVPDSASSAASFETLRLGLGRKYAQASVTIRERHVRVVLQATLKGFLVYRLRGASSVRRWDAVLPEVQATAPDEAAVSMARRLFSRMKGTFSYEEVRDERFERVAAMLAAKTTGRPVPSYDDAKVDISSQLKNSLLAAGPRPVKVARASARKKGAA